MNTLLIFFALPIATIILAIVLQKVLKCPLLVAGTFFAIFLIVTFAVFDASFLVFAILYTILAYITAVLTKLICRLIDEFCNHNHSTIRNMQDRPITINNTSPYTSINLANEANLLASSNGTVETITMAMKIATVIAIGVVEEDNLYLLWLLTESFFMLIDILQIYYKYIKFILQRNNLVVFNRKMLYN